MFKPSEDQINLAQDFVGKNLPSSQIYRICVKLLPSTSKLKAGELAKFEFLASVDFESQTKEQTERENRGSHLAILCHIGPAAFKGDLDLGDLAPAEGDVIVLNKYPALHQEFPPGSGDIYGFINDEDIMASYDCNVLGNKDGK